jgi:NitT/TauT family transport system substrate-binding protein
MEQSPAAMLQAGEGCVAAAAHSAAMKRSSVLALAAATGAAAVTRAAGAQESALKVASAAIESSAEPYYANDGGFFKTAGIDVTFMGGNNGPAIAAGVAGGAIDIGMSNTVSLVQARAKGLPFVIVAPGSIYTAKQPSSLMVVPKASSAQNAKDLTGKVVGVSVLNGVPHYAARAWIDAAGGNSATTKFVEVPYAEMLAALSQGRVDAASITEPYLTPARSFTRSIGAPFDAVAPQFLVTAHFTTLDWAKAHPDLLRRYVDAIGKTAPWANAHPELIVPILAKYSKQPEDTVRAMQRSAFGETLNARELQPVIDVTAKYAGIARYPADDILYRTR